MNDTPTLTVEVTLLLAMSLMKKGDRDWRLARDIHAMVEMEQEEQAMPFRLPVAEEEFEALLEQDARFVALGHGFFALEGVEVDMGRFNQLIAMGMFG